MMYKSDSETILSNTPIKNVPEDYYPRGHGHWFKLTDGLDAGKTMFYRDSIYGKGNTEATIVFVHGNPECSYTYRKVIKNLIDSVETSFRIVSMDHIGFGLSDQASFEMVCMDHSQNLQQLIEKLDLNNVTLIVHDWGGPIGIGAFLKCPKRVSNLVLLNTTVFPMPKTGMTYQNYPLKRLPWSKLPKTIPDAFWGAFASFAIFYNLNNPEDLLVNLPKMLASAKVKGTLLENETMAQRLFREQFQSLSNTLSSKRLVLQTPEWGYGNKYIEPNLGERDTTPFYQFIQENLTKFWGPNGQNIKVRAILGKNDPLAKEEVIKQWIDHLPQLKDFVQVFENANHFIEECEPEAISSAIKEVSGL